jgi:CheY-like chemotaxis protein
MSGHCRELEILHIEDDLVVAQMYRLGLEYAGYRVTVVADGVAGLQVAANGQFDLLLLDMHLPAIDGLELLRQLRLQERNRELAVVILSNWDPDDSILARAEKFGILACLVKSQTTPTVLINHIRGFFRPSSFGAVQLFG